ncbi:uncharacterized protein B0I36DRAFT_356230 [Microdochium trichocladiopsis]|uniref:Uncharacterized protein n=1 Tax=Microdochium trichocladiopsis TaxID=1682393 RepID=A0A9P8XTP0_9PEZI|nr:uncharacterized protein B0I36DRAFT_356230 [Microdochium trichocladiopsis]KAH7012134.1 hypothetical protein B0I36DRAFT_356230 [Microdochium trichocladiopsis]
MAHLQNLGFDEFVEFSDARSRYLVLGPYREISKQFLGVAKLMDIEIPELQAIPEDSGEDTDGDNYIKEQTKRFDSIVTFHEYNPMLGETAVDRASFIKEHFKYIKQHLRKLQTIPKEPEGNSCDGDTYDQ